MCVHETKWKGDIVKDIGDGYKTFYTGKTSERNGFGVILDKVVKRNNFIRLL